MFALSNYNENLILSGMGLLLPLLLVATLCGNIVSGVSYWQDSIQILIR